VLRSKIRRLPGVHKATLKALVEHLSRVASHANKNKMDAKNLAIVFSPVVFGEDEIPQGDLLSVQPTKDSLMENIIDNAHTLFDDCLLPSSPPLPPAPAGEPVPVISYGSKVALPPLPQSGEALGVDFTPQLPPRPAGSIHPSTRSNPPMSPSRLSADPSASAQSIPPAVLPLRIKTTTDATEQSMRESLVSDTSTLVEKAPLRTQNFVPSPTTTRERYQGEQQSEVESVPETPLTTSSLAGSSLNFSH